MNMSLYIAAGFLGSIALANFLGLLSRIFPGLQPILGMGLGIVLAVGMGLVICQDDSDRPIKIWCLGAVAIIAGVILSGV